MVLGFRVSGMVQGVAELCGLQSPAHKEFHVCVLLKAGQDVKG